jgi:hypothetical protein
MPPNTGVPTLRRANSEAPVATTNGRSPRIKANDVNRNARRTDSSAFARERNACPYRQ